MQMKSDLQDGFEVRTHIGLELHAEHLQQHTTCVCRFVLSTLAEAVLPAEAEHVHQRFCLLLRVG